MKFSHADIVSLLLILLGVAFVADVVTTFYILEKGGMELNVHIAPFASDPIQFFSIKMIAIFLIYGLALLSRRFMKKGDLLVLATTCAMAIFSVFWNMRILIALV
jgi:hypothetical protein